MELSTTMDQIHLDTERYTSLQINIQQSQKHKKSKEKKSLTVNGMGPLTHFFIKIFFFLI